MEFKGAELALNDVLRMEEIMEKVYMQLGNLLKIEVAVQCLTATRFYFKLESIPIKYGEYY
jgi:hypothetical protein